MGVNISKILFSTGGVCVASGCAIGGYIVTEKLKDEEESKNKNLPVKNEDSVTQVPKDPVVDKPITKPENDVLPKEKNLIATEDPVLTAPKNKITVAKDEIPSSPSLNTEVIKLPQEEEENFTGKLVVRLEDKGKSKNSGNSISNIGPNDYQLILLTNDEYNTRKNEWMYEVEDGTYVEDHSVFSVDKPVNKKKADDFLTKLNLDLIKWKKGGSTGQEKFDEQFRKHNDKKEFEDIFGEDLYNTILSSISSFQT